MEFIWMCVRLILSLVIVLGVMYLTFKVSGDRINRINRKNYIKVLERSQVSKDNFIVILKVGSKGYVMSSSNGKMEKLQDLSEEEIVSIENRKLEEQNQLNEGYENIINKFKLIFNKYNKKNIR